MFKKKDILIIIILPVVLTAAILFWAFYRESFIVGKTHTLIDNSSKTIVVNLDNSADTKQVISFNFPGNNDNIYIKPLSYGIEKAINAPEQKLLNGSVYDFKDFIFQGKIIKKTRSQKTEYDLLVTTGRLPIIKLDTTDKSKNIQRIPSNKSDDARLDCKLDIFSFERSQSQSDIDVEIKTLGNTSNNEKISYSFNIKPKTIKNFTPEILDFKDSISFKLNPLNLDPSLMRIKLSYDIFNMLSDSEHPDIAPKSEYIELFIDDEYKGVYLLEERVNRRLLNLQKYNKKDLTHSVIYEADETFANLTHGLQGFTQKEPDPLQDKLYLDPLAELVDFINNSSEKTFNEQIDNIIELGNAIDNHILFLLACNQNIEALNQYLYKNNTVNSSQKFLFCPGDYYMSSFGIDSDSIRLNSFKSFKGNILFERLYKDPAYYENFKSRWNSLRKEVLTPENINKLIDKYTNELGDAQKRNLKVVSLNSSPDDYKYQNRSFDSEIKYMKEFINNRISWLDGQINDPPIVKIGSVQAKIYEDYNTIFCALPSGSDPLQEIEYNFKPDSKVYIEPKYHGIKEIYGLLPNYADFYEYEELMNQTTKTDQTFIYIDEPKPNMRVEDHILVRGWALNPNIKYDIDVESIFIFNGPVIGKETFIGKAKTAIPRKDVADYFENPFYENSGFELEINTFNLVNGSYEFYIYVFSNSGRYSVYVLPLEIYNKDHVPGKVQIASGQKFDFKDLIFHGSMIVEDSDDTSREYDLWVTTGSLPVVTISTNPMDLNFNEKIEGKIKIIDSSEYFEGNIGINLRGNWDSNISGKKQYSIEIRDDYSNKKNIGLLGMPEENDWILNGPLTDRSLIRNAAAFKLSNEIGLYAPRNKFVELLVTDEDDTEDYRGVYAFTERIKVDKNRVDITKISDTNQYNPNVDFFDFLDININNGFILEITGADRINPDDLFMTTYKGIGTLLEVKYPDKSVITQEQKKWLENFLNEFLGTLYGDDFTDPIKGYYRYIDMDCLVDYVLINELFRNYDTFSYSTVFTIDVDSKIKFGPVWDFDLSTGNSITKPYYYNQPEGWTYDERQWAERFFVDDIFMDKFCKRWKDLRKSVLSDTNIVSIIESSTNELSDAQVRNFIRWDNSVVTFFDTAPGYGLGVWGMIAIGEADPYTEEIDKIKVWLNKRTEWLDENIDFD